jgi:polysaccharide biosynthesis transport protein
VQVQDVYRALWRHRFFIIVLTSCLVAAAWYATSRQERIYEASTLIQILQPIDDPSETSTSLETGERLAQTYAKIAETANIAARVDQLLLGRVAKADVDISAEPLADLELLSIKARDSDPRRAALVANTAPRALDRFIRESGGLEDKIITVERATVPTSPVSPRLGFNLALALLLGLILNGALALLLEVLGDRVRDADELERISGQPILGTIPSLKFTRPRELERDTRSALQQLERMQSG